jgi:hypothetical protein
MYERGRARFHSVDPERSELDRVNVHFRLARRQQCQQLPVEPSVVPGENVNVLISSGR